MVNTSLPISDNFTLKEFLNSDLAERDNILKQKQFNPPTKVIDNIEYLVQCSLQPIRNQFNFPIRITSGYRCPKLNRLVGGSPNSQHCVGEAADCALSRTFLTTESASNIREEIKSKVQVITGRKLMPDVNENFFLFAYICIFLEELDVDQVIHEYGEGFGQPAWIHISASNRQSSRQILFVGSYTKKKYLRPSLEESLAYATLKK